MAGSPARADAEDRSGRANPPPRPCPRPLPAPAPGGRRTREPLRAPSAVGGAALDADTAPRGLKGAGAGGAATSSPHAPRPGRRHLRLQAPGFLQAVKKRGGRAVGREGAHGDAPAASARPSPVRLQDPAPSPGAGRGAARRSGLRGLDARAPPRGWPPPRPHPPATTELLPLPPPDTGAGEVGGVQFGFQRLGSWHL